MEHKIVLEKKGQVWLAYLKNKPIVNGVSKIKSEAIGSLWNFMVGDLILDSPEKFGVEIEEKKVK